MKVSSVFLVHQNAKTACLRSLCSFGTGDNDWSTRRPVMIGIRVSSYLLSIVFGNCVTIRGINSIGLDAQMALIRFRQASESGEEVGVILINPDQIVSIIVFNNVTEIHTVDGKAQWVKETPEEVASKIQNPR